MKEIDKMNILGGTMGKKRSRGVTIIGCLEVIIGILGTYIFIKNLWIFLENYPFYKLWLFSEEFSCLPRDKAIIFSPMPLVLCAGIGVLELKSWGRKMTLFFSSPYLTIFPNFLFSLIFIRVFLRGKAASSTADIILSFICSTTVTLMFILPFIGTLMRPKVKALFSPERGEAESKEAV